MNGDLLGLVVFLSCIGGFILLFALAYICEYCHERSSRSNRYDIDTLNPPEPPIPMSGQQRGDASNGFSETDANAPAFTYQYGGVVLPPPVVMRDKDGFSSGSSSTGSTLPPMYMDGSDR